MTAPGQSDDDADRNNKHRDRDTCARPTRPPAAFQQLVV
jgi:hypothetical protein